MRTRDIENVISSAMYGDSDIVFEKSYILHTNNYNIYYNNTLMSYMVYVENPEDEYNPYVFMVISIARSVDRAWNSILKKLISVANSYDIIVIASSAFDIGYGADCSERDNKTIKKDLEYIKRFSQDDLKTSAVLKQRIFDKYGYIYSYNQKLSNKERYTHAEEALYLYVTKAYPENTKFEEMYSLLEPCEMCLNYMLELGLPIVYYYMFHKQKWNTSEYIQLTNDIWNRYYNMKYEYIGEEKR